MTHPDLTSTLAYTHQNHDRFLQELKDLCSIPSISTSPDHKDDMQRTAEWLAAKLHSIGMTDARVIPTPGNPVVYAERKSTRNDVPTILVYGHYDVQPPEPLELWSSQPFEPEQRGENLYARGASDMKGQVMASIDAVDTVLQNGALPCHIKFIIEGEEEIGSPHLRDFLVANRDLLACDMALNPDAGMVGPNTPSIVYALRGLSYFELRVYGPKHDLHSGSYGGVVHNPAQALCELIAGMHDSNGTVTLPGFYDRVRPLDAEERAELARLPLSADHFQQETGVSELWGESQFTPIERVGARPTLEVNGLYSGYTGKGSKTVLPAWAMAKISMRLVADQDPAEVHQQLLRYLEEHAPKTIHWEVTPMSGGAPCITDRNTRGTQALVKALETVWGSRPVFKREGGSIPVVGDMQKILNADSVVTGFGLPDDNIHAPNEKLHLPTWFKGIDALVHFFYYL
ncbi:MAG: dipeptidase [Anaerolineaceae bacterium]